MMPMQIGLDELISMLVARLDGLTMDSENQKNRFNIMFRVLYKKGLFDEKDVLESIREEHQLLHSLGLLKELPEDKALETMADALMMWIKGDEEALRKYIEEYDKKIKEAMAKQQKPKIDVASPAVLDQLDRLGGQNSGGGKKLIL